MADETLVVATETTTENGGSEAPSHETKPKRTEAETTAYNLRKQAEKAKELGLDPADVLGLKLKVKSDVSDDEPLTVGRLREFQATEAHETALRMADSITDESERERVREILENRIKPSGDAQADLALARAAATSERSARIVEEIARKGTPSRTAPGGSAAVPVEDDFVPTEQEKIFMARPYNLSKEQVKAMRK